MHARKPFPVKLTTLLLCLSAAAARAGDADLNIPPLDKVAFDGLWGVTGMQLMYMGIVMCAIGAIFGRAQRLRSLCPSLGNQLAARKH